MNEQSLTFQTAQLAGELLMESNCEAYRVEQTLTHILSTIPHKHISIIALATGLYMSFTDHNDQIHTSVIRIKNRDINLDNITTINRLSFKLTEGTISIDEMYQTLKKIKPSPYTPIQKSLGTIFFILFFSTLLSATTTEILFLIPLTLGFVFIEYKLQMKPMIKQFILSFFVSLYVSFINQSVRQDILIISGIMPLVPGTALTNGVRDIFKTDYLSGLAKLIEATFIALFIALGIAGGFFIGKQVFLWF